MAKKILITGPSGLIGTRLTELLVERRYEVVHLGRGSISGKIPRFAWIPETGSMDSASLDGVDTIIHLAGANVADGRWTDARKHVLMESRVNSTNLLFDHLRKRNQTLPTFVSASAIGYYGFGGGTTVFTEKDFPGNDFLARLVVAWETAVDQIATLGTRVVKLRIGIALSEKGGAFRSMMKPVTWGVGSALGSGEQYLSWVHLDDACEAFIKSVEDDQMTGPYNVAGTQPVTNSEMINVIARVLGKKLWAPAVPAFVLSLILGEMADIVLQGSKVSSNKLQRTGFQFKYNELESALRDLLNKNR